MKYRFRRRPSSEAHIGNVTIGGTWPIAIQSMTNTPTLDTDASAAQVIRIAEAGADIVRLTAQGVAHAKNLENIRAKVREYGIDVPLVADIHFNPAAAFEAALHVEKVRINPGNFVDPGRTFKQLEYTDEEYAAELAKIEDKLVPLLRLCREHSTALRIGVNHGSLSDRIMSRYGDTPAGMVESAMEFLRVCVKENFTDVVISIKASNVVVMTQTVRLLVEAMDAENMHFPLHLGVTEAGDGEDGRVKSAVGIGSLLADGIGDTIRVSLSEAPEAEVPVAQALLSHIARMKDAEINYDLSNAQTFQRPNAPTPVAVGVDFAPDAIPDKYVVVTAETTNAPAELKGKILLLDGSRPVIARISYPSGRTIDDVTIAASVDLGKLLLEHLVDGIWIDAPHLPAEALASLSLSIMQATRRRISKTEYIACPGCGRTLFDLPAALHKVREATSHLPGLKIAVMGCIVNGPGEMADADYGYVGAAAGNVSLYKGKQCMVKNIPTDEALPRLIQLIKDNGDWTDPR